MVHRRWLALALLCAVSCGGSDNPSSPTSPSAPVTPTTTRVIELEGNLAFGDVQVGQEGEQTLRIHNRGNAVMTVTGMQISAGTDGAFVSTFTNGTIAAGASQEAVVSFRPTAARSYNATLTVNGDQTSGANTKPISAAGVPVPRPRWSRTGRGNSVFDMPLDVQRVRIIGSYGSRGSNFIVYVAGRLVVNEIIGTSYDTTRYQGDHLLRSGGVVEVVNSSGVDWSFEELR